MKVSNSSGLGLEFKNRLTDKKMITFLENKRYFGSVFNIKFFAQVWQ